MFAGEECGWRLVVAVERARARSHDEQDDPGITKTLKG
jgi:hypothetical protein